MARPGRSWPLRAITLIRPAAPLSAPELALGTFVSVSSWPDLNVTVPNANAILPAFVSVSTFPALSATAGFSALPELAPFVSVSSWPSLRVVVPLIPGARMTGVDGEIQFRDTVWTPGGIYTPLDDVEGWDDNPGITSGDTDKPQGHGGWSGISTADPRFVTATIWVRDDSPTWASSLAALRSITRVPEDETTYPLVIRTRGETWMIWGKIRSRIVPPALIGLGTSQVAIQWACPDPRRYGMTEYTQHVAAGQTVGIANDGDAPTSPTLVFYGPAVGPRVTWSGQSLAFNVELLDGETLTVDTRLGTVEWSTLDYAPVDDFSIPVEEFSIPADGADVIYEPDSGGANGLDFMWRHATW